MNARGVTVFLTTHYLEEAEALCDQIAIINHGSVIACDSTRNLVARLDGKGLFVEVDEDLEHRTSPLPSGLMELGFRISECGRLHVTYRRGHVKAARLIGAVQAAGFHIVDLETRQSDLEDVFVALTSDDDQADRAASGSEHAA